MRDLRSLVLSRLSDVRKLLTADSTEAKAEISKHVQTVTLMPEARVYNMSGSWDLIGTARMDGAGGQSRTAYAGLFRAALYR